MEVFGAVAAALTLLEATNTAVSTIRTIIDAPEYARQLQAELEDFQSVVTQFYLVVKNPRVAANIPTDAWNRVHQGAQDTVSKIQAALDHTRAGRGGLPLFRVRIAVARDACEGYRRRLRLHSGVLSHLLLSAAIVSTSLTSEGAMVLLGQQLVSVGSVKCLHLGGSANTDKHFSRQ